MTMFVCLSVCRQSPICEACTKTIKPINVKIYGNVGTMNVDYRMQYYDVIKSPRWRTAVNVIRVTQRRTISQIMIRFGMRIR